MTHTRVDEDGGKAEVLALVRRLIEAIHAGDVETYRSLCSADLTCFETDVAPYRIQGVDFHVDLMNAIREGGGNRDLAGFEILDPIVQIHGGCAVASYTRLMTYVSAGGPSFRTFNESRVFAHAEGGWKMIHFHRSGG